MAETKRLFFATAQRFGWMWLLSTDVYGSGFFVILHQWAFGSVPPQFFPWVKGHSLPDCRVW